MNLEEAEAMLAESAKVASCTTAVNFQFRFEPGIEVLKSQIESGVIGNLYAVDFSWLTAGRADPQLPWTWRNDHVAGGGVIGAFFSHAADLVWWLAQKETRAIFGQTTILVKHRRDESARLREVTAEDMLTAQLRLEGGVTATCRISNCQKGGEGMRIEARGSSGTLTYRHAPPFAPEDQEVSLSVDERQDILVPISRAERLLDGVDSRLRAVCVSASHFLRKVQGNSDTSAPDFVDGLRAQRVMHGLRQSVLTGQNFVL
jgi:predicted dehydrogenase